MLGLALLAMPWAEAAEYLIAPGDTLELRVAGMPDISQRAQVQQDGTLSLAGVGDVRVGGRSLADTRAKIGLALASKVFPQRSSDGQSHIVTVQPNDISISIVEYRPVYIGGDVTTPGQHVFRPSMTVRQVLALSGGVNPARSRLLAQSDPLELQTQIVSTGAQLAKEELRARRLQAALDNQTELGPVRLTDVPVARSTLSELAATETEALKAGQEAHEREKAFLQAAIRRADEQIAALTAEESLQSKAVESEQEDFGRASKAYAAGALPSPRIAETRRALATSATRRMQILSSLVQLRSQREEHRERLSKLIDDRRIGLLAALNETRIHVIELRARLDGARDRAEAIASGRGFAIEPDAHAKLDIQRKAGTQWVSIGATLDTELRPGDVVNVRAQPASDLREPGS